MIAQLPDVPQIDFPNGVQKPKGCNKWLQARSGEQVGDSEPIKAQHAQLRSTMGLEGAVPDIGFYRAIGFTVPRPNQLHAPQRGLPAPEMDLTPRTPPSSHPGAGGFSCEANPSGCPKGIILSICLNALVLLSHSRKCTSTCI